MADHKAVCCARKPAICEQCNGIAETCANQRGGDGEHLPHTRSAFWAFVADHHYIAGVNLIFLNRGECNFFVIENSRGTAEVLNIVTRYFYDAAFRREIAF